MRIRPVSEGDFPELLEILNAKYAGTYEFAPYTAKGLQDELKAGAFIAVADDAGRITGSSCLKPMAFGEAIGWLAAGDSESEQRLLAEAESHVKCGRAICFVNDGSPEVNDWLMRGYAIGQRELQMALPLRRFPVGVPPEGVKLRRLYEGEDPRLIDLVNRSFGFQRLKQEEIASWRESPAFNNEWIHVAESASQLVSVTICKEDVEYSRFSGSRRGYIGLGATLPEYRGKGIASLLLASVVNFLYERGFREAVLYTSDANKPSLAVLKRMGFAAHKAYLLMFKHVGSQVRD